MLARLVFLSCLALSAAFVPAAVPARAVAAARPEVASTIVMAPKGAKAKKAAPKKVVKKVVKKAPAAKKPAGEGFFLTKFLVSGRDEGEFLSGAGRKLDDSRVGMLGFKDDKRPTKPVKVTSKSGTINPRDASTW